MSLAHYPTRLLTKNVKIRICRTIILPVVLYRCETWSVKLREEHRLTMFENRVKGKGKSIPVTGRGGPQGCETSRLPHFLDNRLTDGGKVVGLTRRPNFTPQEDS
jgi:hypothetical protein